MIFSHLRRLQKMHLKMLPAYAICCIYLLSLLTNVSIEADSVDPYRTAVWSRSTLFAKEASKTFQQAKKQNGTLGVDFWA